MPSPFYRSPVILRGQRSHSLTTCLPSMSIWPLNEWMNKQMNTWSGEWASSPGTHSYPVFSEEGSWLLQSYLATSPRNWDPEISSARLHGLVPSEDRKPPPGLNPYAPFLGLLLAAASFTIILLFTTQCFCVAEISAEKNIFNLKEVQNVLSLPRPKLSVTCRVVFFFFFL